MLQDVHLKLNPGLPWQHEEALYNIKNQQDATLAVYSLIITQPTNALIVCHLFLNHFFKTLASLHEKQRTQMQDMLPQQY